MRQYGWITADYPIRFDVLVAVTVLYWFRYEKSGYFCHMNSFNKRHNGNEEMNTIERKKETNNDNNNKITEKELNFNVIVWKTNAYELRFCCC